MLKAYVLSQRLKEQREALAPDGAEGEQWRDDPRRGATGPRPGQGGHARLYRDGTTVQDQLRWDEGSPP